MTAIVDISQKISPGMPVFYEMTGRWGLARTIIATWEDYAETAALRTRGKVDRLYRTCMVVMSDNGATHVDSTSHIDPFGETADGIALDQLFGSAVLLDLTHLKPCVYDSFRHFGPERSGIVSVEEITVPELEKACAKAGVTIEKGDVVVLHTGAWRNWPKTEFAGEIVPLGVPALHWLIDRGVRAIGVDEISIDVAPEMGEPHFVLRSRKFWHVENLTRLDRLPSRFAFIAFPVKFEGASASPLRVVALPDRERPPGGRLVDLSQPVVAEFTRASYSKSKRSAVLRWHNIMETRIQETKLLLFSDHASTHIDAPNHFHPQGKTIDEMPLELVTARPACWLDLSHKKHRETIRPEDLARAAEKAGMRRGDVVLIYTGISRLWDTPNYWRSVIPVSPEVVRWLLDREVRVFGVDEDEIDGDVLAWPAHRLLREHEFYIIENLNLWPAVLDLPPRFTFYGLPLPLEGATAAPIRAVAQLDGA